MALGRWLGTLWRLSRVLRALGLAVLLLVALGALAYEVIHHGRPSLGTAALAVVLALVMGWDVRSILARSDEKRLTQRIAHARQMLVALDADARIAHLRGVKRRTIIAGVSLLASVVTLRVCGNNPGVVGWIWLWLALSAVFTLVGAAALLLVRRWSSQVQALR